MYSEAFITKRLARVLLLVIVHITNPFKYGFCRTLSNVKNIAKIHQSLRLRLTGITLVASALNKVGFNYFLSFINASQYEVISWPLT